MSYRDIRLESLKAHPEYYESAYQEQKEFPRLMFEEAIEQAQDERFVLAAFDNDEIAGICGFFPIKNDAHMGLENVGSLIQLYVKPNYRGMGVGLHLVERLIEEGFRIAGIDRIILEVKEENKPAYRLFEQAGYTPYEPDFPP